MECSKLKQPKNYRTYVRSLTSAPRQTCYNRKRYARRSGIDTQTTALLTSGEGSSIQNETNSIQEDNFEKSCRGTNSEAGQLKETIIVGACSCSGVELQEIGSGDSDYSDDAPQKTEQLNDGNLECTNDLNAVASTDMGPLLYDSASLTRKESIALIMAFANRHKLSGAATDDLLKFVSLHCPASNHCCPSLYLLRREFQLPPDQLQFHYYCPSCFVQERQERLSEQSQVS